MGAGPYKVQIAVAVMSVPRTQVAHLHQVMAQAKGRAFGQIIPAQPVARGIAHLKLDVFLQIVSTDLCQALQHKLPCPLLDGGPVLGCSVVNVAYRYDYHQRVLPFGSQRRVYAHRCMHVKGRLIGQG